MHRPKTPHTRSHPPAGDRLPRKALLHTVSVRLGLAVGLSFAAAAAK